MADTKAKYESMLVVSCKSDDEGIAALVKKFQDLIEANSEFEGADVWGKRALAYPINKETQGYYTLFRFTCGPDFPTELERVYKITDGVLRWLVIRLGE